MASIEVFIQLLIIKVVLFLHGTRLKDAFLCKNLLIHKKDDSINSFFTMVGKLKGGKATKLATWRLLNIAQPPTVYNNAKSEELVEISHSLMVWSRNNRGNS